MVNFNSFPTQGNLIAVWASWATGVANNVTVKFVTDTLNNGTICNGATCVYSSAVGPTVQAASNTAAQIFYATITNGGRNDPVTVTFSSAPSSSNCVIVEYSGLDQNYPLDSVSAGYSYSAGSILDSGAAAPANANLLVFGAGTTDTGALSAGNTGSIPFSVIQTNPSGSSITEQNTNAITGNNALQRATATVGPSPPTSGSTVTGNWLMQMAVFRDASWTVAGAWSPVRIKSIRYADQFPGVDIGDQINHASADCPPAGCVIHVAAGNYSFGTAITLSTGYPLTLICDPGGNQNGGSAAATLLKYTKTSGAALTFNASNGGGIQAAR